MGKVSCRESVWVARLLLPLLLFVAGEAKAHQVTAEDISPYFCNQLGGTSSGRSCTAPYRPYKGNACSIYESIDNKYGPVTSWMNSITSSCSASSVLEAKQRTLKSRASLRGYVSLGDDESVNDPVVNESYRPEGATIGAGESYFAAECAIRTCGGGGEGTATAESETDDSGSSGTDTSASNQRPAAPERPTQPQTTRAEELKAYTVSVCNWSSDPTISLAVIYRYRPTDRLRLRAWYSIKKDECQTFSILREPTDPSAIFYYYGRSKSREWKANFETLYTTRCVGSAATDRYVDDYYECKSDDRKLRFIGVRFQGDKTIPLDD